MSNSEEIKQKLENFTETYYQSLPDEIYRHADGKFYIHQTWSDPKISPPRVFKSIDPISKISKEDTQGTNE